jgi:DNA-binding MarR family transcriptional regulator
MSLGSVEIWNRIVLDDIGSEYVTPLETETPGASAAKASSKSAADQTYSDVLRGVGHLIRRCHQIAVGIYWDEFGEFGVTPIQGAILITLKQFPGCDQTQLGGFVALDRTNTATTLTRMEQKGWIERKTSPFDKRIKLVYMTQKADDLLRSMPRVGTVVADRLLDGLTPQEREFFVGILKRIVDQKNRDSRAPHQHLDQRSRKSASAG